MEKVREKVLFALQEVQRAVIGKQEVTETVMKAFLAGGHVLVEDIPGLGKTTMAIAFSRAIGLQKRAVYTGCTSVRPDRIYHLPEREKCVCISSGSRGLQPASGR